MCEIFVQMRLREFSSFSKYCIKFRWLNGIFSTIRLINNHHNEEKKNLHNKVENSLTINQNK